MGLSNAERQARWRGRQQDRIAELERERDHYKALAEQGVPLRNAEDGPRVRELGRELAQTKGRVAELLAQAQADAKEIARLKARAAELEAKSSKRSEPPPLPSTAEEWAARKAAIAAERKQKRAEKPPKPPKPPLPPDEVRDRRIKAQATEIRNLKAQLRHEIEHQAKMEETGIMSFATMSAISRCLHPDKEPPSVELRADALKRFNAWKGDSNKARRKAR
jgi:hypothetical protein